MPSKAGIVIELENLNKSSKEKKSSNNGFSIQKLEDCKSIEETDVFLNNTTNTRDSKMVEGPKRKKSSDGLSKMEGELKEEDENNQLRDSYSEGDLKELLGVKLSPSDVDLKHRGDQSNNNGFSIQKLEDRKSIEETDVCLDNTIETQASKMVEGPKGKKSSSYVDIHLQSEKVATKTHSQSGILAPKPTGNLSPHFDCGGNPIDENEESNDSSHDSLMEQASNGPNQYQMCIHRKKIQRKVIGVGVVVGLLIVGLIVGLVIGTEDGQPSLNGTSTMGPVSGGNLSTIPTMLNFSTQDNKGNTTSGRTTVKIWLKPSPYHEGFVSKMKIDKSLSEYEEMDYAKIFNDSVYVLEPGCYTIKGNITFQPNSNPSATETGCHGLHFYVMKNREQLSEQNATLISNGTNVGNECPDTHRTLSVDGQFKLLEGEKISFEIAGWNVSNLTLEVFVTFSRMRI